MIREHPPPSGEGELCAGSIYSLGLCFLVFFVLFLMLHARGGYAQHCAEALREGEGPGTFWEFTRDAEFWFQSMQNWQSEFLAVGTLVVLTIFLRQKGSPQSKPVTAPHSQTGA